MSISLKWKKIFRKEIRHSSAFWKAFQISTNNFSFHRHFKLATFGVFQRKEKERKEAEALKAAKAKKEAKEKPEAKIQEVTEEEAEKIKKEEAKRKEKEQKETEVKKTDSNKSDENGEVSSFMKNWCAECDNVMKQLHVLFFRCPFRTQREREREREREGGRDFIL